MGRVRGAAAVKVGKKTRHPRRAINQAATGAVMEAAWRVRLTEVQAQQMRR